MKGNSRLGMIVFSLMWVGTFFAFALPSASAQEKGLVLESPVLRNPVIEGPGVIYTAGRGEAYTVYAESMPGEDWGEKINNAVKLLRRRVDGGEVILPPGRLPVSTTINLAGSNDIYRRNYVWGIVLRGTGSGGSTQLMWKGAPNKVVISMPGPWMCQVKNIGIDGGKVPGIIGIRYYGGFERDVGGGKGNAIESIYLRNLHVGIEVGDIYNPDLVSTAFRDIWIWFVDVGIRVVGGNVASMNFYNIAITHYKEAGFLLLGYGARKVRTSPTDKMPKGHTVRDSKVLVTPDGEEVFLKDIPERVKGRLIHPKDKPGESYVGGGHPEIVIYGLNVHANEPNSWMIDTNFATARVYSGRMEGPGGVFRASKWFAGDRFADMLVDFSAVTEGINGNAIEYRKKGPLYIIGGSYNGNIALGAGTQVFANGVSFWRRGADIGFIQLPGTGGARIHETQYRWQATVEVLAGGESATVALQELDRQPDGNYQVLATANWDAGYTWVTEKTRNSFVVNTRNPAPVDGGKIDVIMCRTPWRTYYTSKK